MLEEWLDSRPQTWYWTLAYVIWVTLKLVGWVVIIILQLQLLLWIKSWKPPG